MSDIDQVRAVIQEYADASSVGSADRLRAIFHETAQMSGYLMGNYMTGTPEPFFDTVANPPSGAPSSKNYKAEITDVETSGQVGSAKLVETGFLGMNFTDYFHLTQVDGTWKIISKTFNQE